MHQEYYSSTFTSPVHTTPNLPDHEHLKCPRCDSNNTKFCYYNNYNLSQPRHYCKDCRRYWTKGGTLRNIPIGGGTRKIAKRSKHSIKGVSLTTTTKTTSPEKPEVEPVVYRFGNNNIPVGPFGSLLMEGVHSESSSFNVVRKSDEDVLIRNPNVGEFGSNFLRLNDDSNGNGGSDQWPDLSIFTPGSSFH
ncbi:hypothetical protein M8C21_028434 [Ambrosia artemisiifolia]|uniref:Dof zinc finger protein n=1 Tax=Ambrosia artemisiifolia TaxID=4212 RepID=A0AAD5D0W8_AMBAR|nr:hypothetical protein M8C21_028434 [Ambrosia artemisiifolia]